MDGVAQPRLAVSTELRPALPGPLGQVLSACVVRARCSVSLEPGEVRRCPPDPRSVPQSLGPAGSPDQPGAGVRENLPIERPRMLRPAGARSRRRSPKQSCLDPVPRTRLRSRPVGCGLPVRIGAGNALAHADAPSARDKPARPRLERFMGPSSIHLHVQGPSRRQRHRALPRGASQGPSA